jgi:prepilin-type N-terminal cleavage/methylation domain-containing protein
MKIASDKKAMTFTELMVVIAILAVIGVAATPSILSWRGNVKLRSAADNLKGDLLAAKASAARESSWVVIEFFGDRYRVFVDNGTGTGGAKNDGLLNGSEAVIRQRKLPSGVSIEPSAFTKTHFNARGTTGAAGTVTLVNSRGDRKMLIISPMGRIREQDG